MLLESFFQDVRIGLRVLVKEKSFCALAVVVIALGICGVTTMFSVVNGVMLRGFSFPNADRLVSVEFIDPAQATIFGNATQVYALDYQELRRSCRSFEHIGAYVGYATINVTYQGNPARYDGAYVTEDFLKILGLVPLLGRDFTAADNTPGAEKTTIISYQLWQRDFGGRPDIVGQAVRINGRAATIIGVMPPRFRFPVSEELWVPLFNEYPPRARNDPARTGGNTPTVFAALRPGVSLEQASLEVTGAASRLAQEFPDTNKAYATGLVEPLIRNFTPRAIQGLLFAMLGVCVAVLLLACANVMNMQFARATLRAKELAIRSSLGATRGRLVRQMLTESLLLAALGAVLGVGLAFWSTDLLMAIASSLPVPLPSYIVFDIDRAVLAFVVFATVLAAIVSGVLPAWLSSRANAVEVLKETGRGHTSRGVTLFTRGLVVLTILLTSVILVASLLQMKAIVNQQTVDYGYDTTALATARFGLMEGEYPGSAARRQLLDRLLRELRAAPGIESAALSNRLRMAFTFAGPVRIAIEGRGYKTYRDHPNVNAENVSDGYFATLGVKLREGRDFNADDLDPRLPVAIVTAGFAQKYFPGQSAIGRRFRTLAGEAAPPGPWRTIVGVVSDVRMVGPFNVPNVEPEGFFLPYYSPPLGPPEILAPQFSTIVVRPRGGHAAAFQSQLRAAVKRVEPDLALYFMGTAKEGIDAFTGVNRIVGTMFSVFAVVALVLAAVGLYGVMSFSVNQRTQEFGIRMALGANPRTILRMVARQGAAQLATGLVLGLGAALAAGLAGGPGLRTMLFNVSPFDPLVYAAVIALLALVAFVATLVPARRATRVDPMTALRAE